MMKVSKSQNSKIAIYSRKSKFTGKGESIENQIELCRKYILLHYSGIDGDDILIYEDEGYSGGNTDRPKFLALMNDVYGGYISTVICYRLDRISRNISDFTKLIEEFNARRVSFVSIKEQFDTSSSIGRAMMYIASVFSQLERETIAERIRDNMLELAKTGRWLGGTTPTGYASEAIEKVTIDGKVHKAFMLMVIPEEVRMVQMIFNKFLELNSLTKVETYLLQNHLKTKNKKAYSRFAIKNILENPVYAVSDVKTYEYFKNIEVEIFGGKEAFDGKHGIMAYNKTIQQRGRSNQVRDMSEWIIAVGKHDGIIKGTDWVKAQALLEQNRSRSYRRVKNGSALVSGILYCICGSYMRPKQSQRLNADGEMIYSYLCEAKEKSHGQNCNIKNINGNILDKMICDEIGKLSQGQDMFIHAMEMERENILSDSDEYSEEFARLRGVAAETEKEIGTLVSVLSHSPETAQEYIVKQIAGLHEKIASARERIDELDNITQKRKLSSTEISSIKTELSLFAGVFHTMGMERKREAVRSLIQKIVWDGEDVLLYLCGVAEPHRTDSK